MAEFVLGLTKTAVEGTLIRVKSAIEEERSLRMRVQDDLLFITGEFEMLLSFLSVANTERTSNRVVRTWVRQLRELAFDVEDCVEFVVHLDKPSRWDWVRRLTSSLICMARPPLPLDEAVTEIKQLRTRLEDVSQRNTRYSLIGAGNDDSSSGSNPGLVAPATAAEAAATAFHILCEVWEATGKKQHDIGQGDLKKLIDCQGSDLQVLSVWGSTGGGAAPDIGPSITHVIRKAYDDPEICQVFKSRAWVKLVHPFNPDEFLESLLTQFFANSHQEKICVVDDLKKDNLMQQVREQRYLIVLDQVSTVEDWEAIRMYLPDSNKGSRIVMSTQRLGIALLCTGEPYQVSEITRCSHSQPRFSRSQPLRAIYNKGSGHRSGIGEFIRQLRSRGVISVWGAGCDESLLIPNLCQGIMDKSKVFDGLKFQHYLEFTVSDDLDLLMEMAAELCIYSNPQDQQHKMKDKFHEMDRSKIIETWCTFLAAYDELYLIVIMGLKSKDNWDLIKKNLLFEPTKCCVVVLTEDEILSRHCVDYEYRTHMLEDIQQDYQQNCGQGGKRREEENWKLVRREDDMNRIGNCLARHGVISVWGIAGVGKSALVRNWTSVGVYFWIFILMIFKPKKLHLLSTHDWDLIKPLFMSQHSESHIILITNEERVATHCTYNTDGMVNVKCLEADAAIELFK
ncbi:Disease resistance protein RPP13 [Triticum urartu]|uniref:Disease resistance protein RPP13 n=1 Tax=Triticum urartu TaxID=4572 RepID=M7Z8S9_TRIUA|nr:Disease resistance protein RPP13 [Triticum urartu]